MFQLELQLCLFACTHRIQCCMKQTVFFFCCVIIYQVAKRSLKLYKHGETYQINFLIGLTSFALPYIRRLFFLVLFHYFSIKAVSHSKSNHKIRKSFNFYAHQQKKRRCFWKYRFSYSLQVCSCWAKWTHWALADTGPSRTSTGARLFLTVSLRFTADFLWLGSLNLFSIFFRPWQPGVRLLNQRETFRLWIVRLHFLFCFFW